LSGIHEQPVQLISGSVTCNLGGHKTAAGRVARVITGAGAVTAIRRHAVVELLAEVRFLDRKRKTIYVEVGPTRSNSSGALTTRLTPSFSDRRCHP
jgi:hypothetical protein